jgi:hypothetical protein
MKKGKKRHSYYTKYVFTRFNQRSNIVLNVSIIRGGKRGGSWEETSQKV